MPRIKVTREKPLDEQVEDYASSKKKKKTRVEFLDTGAPNLNLALSGNVRGGIARGRVVNIVGDGSSGKTILALEIAYRFYKKIKKVKSKLFPKVKKIIIIYDNIEDVMDFPLEEMYGEDFVNAIEWRHSKSIEQWGRRTIKAINKHKRGEAILHITDSLDALVPEASTKRMDKAAEEDKSAGGKAYAEKASYLSQDFFGNLCSKVEGRDFTMIIISQVREKIGVLFGEKRYRTGGKSMDFYTHQVFWLAVIEKITKTIERKKIVNAIRVRAKQKRSKVSKPFREADFQILFDFGIDTINSLLDFLFGQKKTSFKIDGKKLSREKAIQLLQDREHLYERLLGKAQKKWDRIGEKLSPKGRKRII